MENATPTVSADSEADTTVAALEQTPEIESALSGITWLGMMIVLALSALGVWAFPALMFSEEAPHIRFPVAAIVYNIMFASAPGFGEPGDAREFLVVLGGFFGLLAGTYTTIRITATAMLKAGLTHAAKIHLQQPKV